MSLDNKAVTLRSLARPGIEAARLYWRAIVVLQAIALLLVAGYSYQLPAIHGFCTRLTALREHWGIVMAIVGSIVAGAILPEIAKLLLPRSSRQSLSVGDLLANVAFFAGAGAIVDTQYRFLALILGSDMGMATAIGKMLIDQLLMTPIYGVPYWILVYEWKANGFAILPTLRPVGPRWYLTRVLPLLIPAWVYWIPMTLMIYSLPMQLQFVLFALAMAGWSLVMVFIARVQAAPDSEGFIAPDIDADGDSAAANLDRLAIAHSPAPALPARSARENGRV